MPTISDERVFGLIDLIYENITENSGEKWKDTYKTITETFSAGPGSLSIFQEDTNHFELLISTLDEEIYREYISYYYKLSPFRKKIEKMSAGETFRRSAHLSDKNFRKTAIYREYFKRQDVFHFDYEVLFRENGISGGITFTRPESMRNFTPQEAEAMRLMNTHLRRAFYVYYKVKIAGQDTRLLEDILDKIPQSVMVVNKKGKVIYRNDGAKKMLEKNDGLQINRRGNLLAGLTRDTAKLKRLLSGVFNPPSGRKDIYGGIARISRPSGRKPFAVLVSPVSEKTDSCFGSETLALMFVTDPEKKFEPKEKVLSEVYGLTPAEARLVCILTGGKSIKEACGILEITENTARTHLKRIFSKTDTHRQSDLLRLILNGPANLMQTE